MTILDRFMAVPKVRAISPDRDIPPYWSSNKALSVPQSQAFPHGPAVVNHGTGFELATFSGKHWLADGAGGAGDARRAAQLVLKQNPEVDAITYRSINTPQYRGIHLAAIDVHEGVESIVDTLSRYPDH
jgi:hypothetical protein